MLKKRYVYINNVNNKRNTIITIIISVSHFRNYKLVTSKSLAIVISNADVVYYDKCQFRYPISGKKYLINV